MARHITTNRRGWGLLWGVFLVNGLLPSPAPAAPPDIVVFLSDDHTLRDCSVYGSPDIQTPNMDRLAAAGMVFNRAYVASPSCAPSRAALLTGLFPARNAAEANHSRPQADIKKLPAYFQERGYQVVSFGKVGHYKQTPEYGFDIARHFTYHEDIAIPKAVEWLQQRKSRKPLCLFVGTNWPHVPWPDLPEGVDPDSLVIPPTHVDNPTTRAWRSRYVAAIAAMDRELGLVYDAAREVLGNDTFFLHTSDHGAQWPFAKWNLYDAGIRTPMIIHWPGKIKAGARTDAMVSWIDLMPTLIDFAGGTVPQDIDGRSFADVLRGKTESHRDVIYTTTSGDGIMNVYPIRSVRTDRFKYIRNLRPDCYHSNHSDILRNDGRGGYWDSWDAAAEKDPEAAAVVRKYYQRPPVEFFDLDNDPTEQNNLAEDPEYADQLEKMSAMLDAWMKEQGDSGKVFQEPYPLTGPRPVEIVPELTKK